MDTQIRKLEELARSPGLSGSDRALRLATLATAELAADTGTELDRAVEHLRQALEESPVYDPRRVYYYLMSLGMTHLRRLEVTGRRDDLVAGTSRLEQARELAGSAAHVYWTMCSNPLAHAYRMSGRRDLGRRVALSGLRGHAWTVLLQSNASDVHDAARHAADDALDVARWCMEDNDPEGAATALDAGRGLILYTATETRDAETRLLALGEHHLAQQWQQALAMAGPLEVPSELRRRVVSALARIPLLPDGSLAASPAEGSARLLDPPSVHEVRAALGALNADALVYLVPGDERSGAAVVIPANDVPSWMMLPELNARRLADFDRYLTGAAESMTGAETIGDGEGSWDPLHRSRRALEEVCDWAWDAAIGPLLAEHLSLPADRPIRLVLIPMRELTRVPWYAARHRVGGRTEYALHRAVLSYAASARLLCESAWRGDVLLTATGLVVGDPDTHGEGRDLPAARAEASAIRETFYPAARYVGRRADGTPSLEGAGTRADTIDWLADPNGGSVVHLACHGVVRSGRADQTSYLLLAGGHLSAEELIKLLAVRPGRNIALAVLAACSSAEPSRGYDEAFSLATAFLASNVRSVISRQWSVPDAPTSDLMFMLHYYLREEGLPPADTLREA